MERDEAEKEIAPSSSRCLRRDFLKQAALATAGITAVGLRPAIGQAGTCEIAQPLPRSCPDGRTPMKEVEGKVAFITGGSSGIGLGIARAFADARMKVVIGYRTTQHLDEAMRFLGNARDRVHAIRVDVTDRPGMEKAAAETVDVFGKIHVLVNNAGVVGFGPLSSTTYDDWDWLMSVNVSGVFNGVHSFLPRIQAHGEGGQVITISSLNGLVPRSDAASYSASKFAVVGLMEALRAELADTNIGVSVCCPGAVRSNIVSSARNRPSHLSNSGFRQDPTVSAPPKESIPTAQSVMEPYEAGQLVLQGMRNNDLYILTHLGFEQILRDRYEALMSSLPADSVPAKRRPAVRDSIYAAERDRRLCSQAAVLKQLRN